MNKPLEGDGLTLARCNGCGGLSIVILSHGEPIAFVCLLDEALLQIAERITSSFETIPAGEMVQ